MDYLDPKKQRAHGRRLIVGYILIGLGILIATAILVRIAYGFGLDKNGEVVQNGFAFVSSQPENADIYLDGKKYKDTTNSRLQLAAGNYSIEVRRQGYTNWQRPITVTGGTIVRYDYPLLVPTSLAPTSLKTYAASPAFMTQSPDRRWALIQQGTELTTFDVYDLGDPEEVAANTQAVTLPDNLLTEAPGTHSWTLTEWSTDNKHVILQHSYEGGSEYILVDHTEPAASVNLTQTLKLAAGQTLSLRDKKYDRYYLFDPAAATVNQVTLEEPIAVTPVLTGVLAFKSYGDDMLLYATAIDAPAGKVLTMLRDDDITYKIRDHAVGGPYLLDLAKYDGDWYVAVGSSADNKAYVFRNPQTVRKQAKLQNLVPARVLRVTAPNYLAFSSNTRFVMIENATSFAVYDAEYDESYTYATSQPIDAPQQHATWMDGHRLTYVSGGKTLIFDYDSPNPRSLVAANSAFLPVFDRDYRMVYNVAPPAAANGQTVLTQTSLLTEADR